MWGPWLKTPRVCNDVYPRRFGWGSRPGWRLSTPGDGVFEAPPMKVSCPGMEATPSVPGLGANLKTRASRSPDPPIRDFGLAISNATGIGVRVPGNRVSGRAMAFFCAVYVTELPKWCRSGALVVDFAGPEPFNPSQ